jgi:predicted RNase H-like HicB family nuclease
MYRLGRPCATFFAEMGMPLLIKVEIIHDKVANVYVATSPDLKGLVVEAETLDELEKEVWDLVPELLTLDMPRLCVKTVTHLSFFQPPVAVSIAMKNW